MVLFALWQIFEVLDNESKSYYFYMYLVPGTNTVATQYSKGTGLEDL